MERTVSGIGNTAATGSVARGNDPTCPPPPTTSAQPPPTTSALATPGDGATSVDLLPSGHSAAIRLTPNGNYLLVLEIPPRSVLSSAPPSGGVKGADLIDDEPDGVEDDVFVASFPVTSMGWPIGAPVALTGLIQSKLQWHPQWRIPAGHELRLQPGLAATAITAYRQGDHAPERRASACVRRGLLHLLPEFQGSRCC
jgi:hypothetical protein